MGHLLVAQSGGPTAAINATLAGVISAAYKSGKKVYGALNGIEGVLKEELVCLNDIGADKQLLEKLLKTPSSALGSCRHKLQSLEVDESEYKSIVSTLQKHDIDSFVYIGGNDSMDTVHKLSVYMQKEGIQGISVMGAPKTIDNDLCCTDHTPGFGSAAKYIGVTFAELARDCRVYQMPAVTVVEVMGRDAGWLTASAALAWVSGDGPDLIYLPEHPFSIESFLEDVGTLLAQNKAILVAVSEGVKDSDGNYVGESHLSTKEDAFGHKQLAGVSEYLIAQIDARFHCKVRAIQFNLMQRCASHIASATDLQESFTLGETAAHAAMKGVSGQMSCIVRKEGTPYQVSYATTHVSQVANSVKCVPQEWITANGNNVTKELLDYVQPLIQGEVTLPFVNGIPQFFILDKEKRSI